MIRKILIVVLVSMYFIFNQTTQLKAANFEVAYANLSMSGNGWVDPGSYSFQVTGIPWGYSIQWRLNNVVQKTDNIGILNGGVYSRSFGACEGVNAIQGRVYNGSNATGTLIGTVTWNIYVNQPDLIVSSCSVQGSSTINPGVSLTVNWTISNQGSMVANIPTLQFSGLHFYLSTRSTYDASAILLGTQNINDFAAGESRSGSQTLTIPAGTSCGTRYIILYVDFADDVEECNNEGNNTNYVQISVGSFSTAPTSVSASPPNICPGNTSTLTVVGGSLAPGAFWRWYSGSCGGTYFNSGSSIVVSPSSSTTYFVRAEGGTCGFITNCANTTVSVYTISTAPNGASANPASICSGNATTLTVSGGSLGTGASWRWYSGSCGGTFVNSGSSIIVSPSSTTTYFVRAEGGTCNLTTTCASTTVIVNPSSTAPTGISANPASICSGNASTLTVSGGSLGAGASWMWYSGSCGGTFVNSGSSIIVSPSATTTYFVRAEGGTCNITTTCASTTVIVNPSSTAATGISANPASICSGNASTLTVSGGSLGAGASWMWYSGSCGGTFVNSGSSIIVSPSSTTTYFVRAEGGTCNLTTTCASTTVTVNPSSSAPTGISANPASICSGNTSTLTVSGGSLGAGASWMWYSGSCGGTFVNSGSSIIVSPSATTTYFVRAEGGTCNLTTTCASTTVIVNPSSSAPTGISANPASICSGNATTLTVSGGSLGAGASWMWYSGSCGGTFVNSGSSIIVSPSATTTYFVRAEGGTCNLTTTCASTTVIVNPSSSAPTGISANPASICSGNTSTLTVTGGSLGAGASWRWYSGSCGGTFVNSGSSIIVSPSATTTYFVRAEGGTCNLTTTCASTTVIVNPSSTAPTGISANPASICSGNASTLTVSGGSLGAGASWMWYSGSCGGTFVNSGSSIIVSPSATTTYFVRAEGGTCNLTTTCASTTVTVNPSSSAPTGISANPASICSGNTSTLTVSGGSLGAGASWMWYSGSCGGTFVNSGSSIIVSPSSTTTYFVRAEGGTCILTTTCANSTVTVTSTIAPTVSINPGTTQTICSGQTVSFTATPTNGGSSPSYQWYLNGSPAGTNSSGYTTPPLTGNAQVYCILTSNSSCANPTSVSSGTTLITINQTVTPGISISPASIQTICSGQTVSFTATPTNGGSSPSYQWYLNGSLAGTNSSGYTTPPLTGNAQVYCILTSNSSCANPTSVSSGTTLITINQTVTPGISISPASIQTICSGQTVSFTATPTNGGSSPSYQWYLNGSPAGTNSSGYTTPPLTGNAQVYCILTSNSSCANPTSVSSGITSIAVNSSSVAPTGASASENTICSGNSSTLTVAGGLLVPGASWNWYSGSCAGNYLGTGSYISVSPASSTTYYVRAEGGICNIPTSCAYVTVNVNNNCNGIESTEIFKGISIYPNPAHDNLIIENDKSKGPIDFEIVNSNGKIILNSILNNRSIINLTRFSSGIYFIRFKEKGSFYTLKFIKK